MGTPDGSAGHPIVTCPEGQDVRSERVSADGVQDTVTLPDSSREHKALIPRGLGAGEARPLLGEAHISHVWSQEKSCQCAAVGTFCCQGAVKQGSYTEFRKYSQGAHTT